MRVANIAFPVCLALTCGALFLAFDIYGLSLRAFFNFSNLALMLTALYYLDATLKYLSLPNPLGFIDASYKFVFIYNFMMTVLYWLVRLYDESYLYDSATRKPLYFVIFCHGGLFTLLLLEQVLWRRHKPNPSYEYLFWLVFGLVLCSLVYVPWFLKDYSVYPFVRTFSEVEFALLPVMIILLFFVGVKAHPYFTAFAEGTEDSNKLLDFN